MKKNNKKYALKEMSKVKIIDRRSEKSIKGEREFLSKLHHPFIVNMACAFQDYENLYLVMDLLTGGDLRYHLCHMQKFSEDETKFFFACLLLGLEYIHGNNIIHRDIKPENLVCEENGYIRITDFGVAKIMKEENSSETSGTPGYMAPEVLFAQNHSFPVDFFAIGIMGYEFMFGERPYIGKNRKEIKHLVFKKQAKIKFEDVPDGWSFESVDFINRCLKRKWNKRLGSTNGVAELKNHSWFRHFNWDKLYDKKKKAPFIPKKGGNYDKKYCEAIEKVNDSTIERYHKYGNQNNFQNLFAEYTYINYDLIPGIFVETNTRVTTKATNTKTSNIQNLSPHINNNAENNNEKNISNPKNENNDGKNEKKNVNNNNDINVGKEKGKLAVNINDMKSTKNQKKSKLNLEIDSQFKLKIDKENKKENAKKENKPNIFSNNSIYKNINNIFNNIKKLAASTNNKLKTNTRSSSVEISNSNLKNNLSQNIAYVKYHKKEINMKYINNNNKHINLNDLSNGPLSNPNRDKLSYKLYKSNSGFGSSMVVNKNNRRDISIIDFGENDNNYMDMKKNNYIQLRKSNEGNKFPFYLPNLNNLSTLYIQGFKKKLKLNLEKAFINQRNNLNLNFNNNNDYKTRNRYFLSPTNKRVKKSESGFFIKTPMNSSVYNLNQNLDINLKDSGEFNNNDNFYNTHRKNNFDNFSKRVFNKRKKSFKK